MTRLLIALFAVLIAASAAEANELIRTFGNGQYSFATDTQTFTGHEFQLPETTQRGAGFTLSATFDAAGEFTSGVFEQHDEFGIAQLVARIRSVSIAPYDHITSFPVDFFLDPDPGFEFAFAGFDHFMFEARVRTGNGGPSTVEEIFSMDYHDLSVPVFSYLWAIAVPQVPTGIAVALGCVALIVVGRRRGAAFRWLDRRFHDADNRQPRSARHACFSRPRSLAGETKTRACRG